MTVKLFYYNRIMICRNEMLVYYKNVLLPQCMKKLLKCFGQSGNDTTNKDHIGILSEPMYFNHKSRIL